MIQDGVLNRKLWKSSGKDGIEMSQEWLGRSRNGSNHAAKPYLDGRETLLATPRSAFMNSGEPLNMRRPNNFQTMDW